MQEEPISQGFDARHGTQPPDAIGAAIDTMRRMLCCIALLNALPGHALERAGDLSNGASAPASVTAWVRVAVEDQPFNLAGTQKVRYGDGIRWVTKTSVGGTCSNAEFGADPAPGTGKFCEAQMTVPAVAQTGAMPVVNRALIPKAGVAYTTARVRALSADELRQETFQPKRSDIGDFREPCNFSHMNFDDPIVFPGRPGASHLHTFAGAAEANSATTGDSLMGPGHSTCMGGTLNRSAYWMPSLIDIRTGQPIVPTGILFYYKQGYLGVKAGTMRPFPKGLRMIAGNSKALAPWGDGFAFNIACNNVGKNKSIPSCPVGDNMVMSVVFPQCWDGSNLDSPDHQSHMAYATGGGCPRTHPVALPEISLNLGYKVTEPDSGRFWKLSSDNYVGPGGYSLHADWFNGWDVDTNKAFLTNCVNAQTDCHAMLLGDGRMLY